MIAVPDQVVEPDLGEEVTLQREAAQWRERIVPWSRFLENRVSGFGATVQIHLLS